VKQITVSSEFNFTQDIMDSGFQTDVGLWAKSTPAMIDFWSTKDYDDIQNVVGGHFSKSILTFKSTKHEGKLIMHRTNVPTITSK
jgi:hypothetical protein